jgi:murein DD-endopeptidase MepM/ murein hydrolase activator NlpD
MQGDTFKITLKFPSKPHKNSIQFLNKNFDTFQRIPNSLDCESYIGIPRNLEPGNYTVTINYQSDTPKKPSTLTLTVTIKDAKFPHSHITLLGEKKTLSDDEDQLSNEVKIIQEKCNIRTQKKLFSSKFIVPTKGKVTTKFGAYRIYNQKKETHRHAGIDIANKQGTPIAAANSGIVVLATNLKSHGNTIIIDHGWGILTLYNHLESLTIKEGQEVQQNQEIGFMGSTGISTGSHLHWGLSVQGTRVNPAYWLSEVKLYNN